MPYKDPEVAKIKKRENYLLNRDKRIAQSAARRIRIQNERNAQKALAAIGPKKPIDRSCKECGCDITFTYKPKQGPLCESCHYDYHKKYRSDNAERIAIKKKAWKEANIDHVRELERGYTVTNAKNKTIARKKWEQNNPGVNSSLKAADRAKRKLRFVSWSNMDKIQPYYDVCSFFNEVNGYAKYHVDHILPLQGKKVSGLHVHNNLRVILAKDNLKKNNKFEVCDGRS